MKRLVSATLAAVALAATAACAPPIPAGTVTGKGRVDKCHWIAVKTTDGDKAKGCVGIAKWKKTRKGDHWPGGR